MNRFAICIVPNLGILSYNKCLIQQMKCIAGTEILRVINRIMITAGEKLSLAYFIFKNIKK